jgi:hypothetical protein
MKWTWRINEKSYKEYTQLAKQDKQLYLDFLLTLEPKILGTNDKYILNNFGPTIKNKEFITLKDFDNEINIK